MLQYLNKEIPPDIRKITPSGNITGNPGEAKEPDRSANEIIFLLLPADHEDCDPIVIFFSSCKNQDKSWSAPSKV